MDRIVNEIFVKCTENLKGKFKLRDWLENPEFLEFLASEENRKEIQGIKRTGDKYRNGTKRTESQKIWHWRRGKVAEFLLIKLVGFKENKNKYCDVIFTDSKGVDHNVEVKTSTGSILSLTKLDESLKRKKKLYEDNKVDFLIYFYYNDDNQTIWFQTVDLMSYHV